MKIVGKTILERRKNSRPRLPSITIVFDGRSYDTTEWTLGGFLIDRYIGDCFVDEVMPVTIRVMIAADVSSSARHGRPAAGQPAAR